MTIREATIHDIPEMVSIGEALLETGDLAGYGIEHNRGAMCSYVAGFIDGENACAYVYEINGAVVGFILALVMPSQLGGGLVGKKASWIMRHSGHGAGLMRAAEAWAASKGAKQWFISLPNALPRPAMERLGYRPIETVYEKDLAPASLTQAE